MHNSKGRVDRFHMYLDAAKRPDVVNRIRQQVTETPSGCWEWNGPRTSRLYGQMSYQNTTLLVHRIMCVVGHGEFDPTRFVDHLCRNPPCVNPEHLEAVTPSVNLIRGVRNAPGRPSRAACGKGHDLTPENTRLSSRGRLCRTCIRAAKSRARARRHLAEHGG